MKTKTLIELITLSSSLYVLARDTHLIDKLGEWTEEKAKDVNDIASQTTLDKDGNELELIDKIKLKAEQVKEELETKIEDVVAKVYKKINIAHLDDIKALQEQLEKADAKIALLEARLNKLEVKS
jgi:BMFP domain-containing protein YqiC